MESLPDREVPAADPLLVQWRQLSLTQWQQKLRDAESAGDDAGVEYAHWMLSEVLGEPLDDE